MRRYPPVSGRLRITELNNRRLSLRTMRGPDRRAIGAALPFPRRRVPGGKQNRDNTASTLAEKVVFIPPLGWAIQFSMAETRAAPARAAG